MTLTLSLPGAAPLPPELARPDWALRIRAAWNKTRDGVIEVGRLLMDAKAALAHGDFAAMIASDLPFGARTAQRLMAVAGDTRLSNPTHASLLPAAWPTLYELSRLAEPVFERALSDGLIRPDMERKEAERLRTGQRRAERLARAETLARGNPPPESLIPPAPGETAAARPLPGGVARRYPVIYADPPTRFETWSGKGQEKSADNHYPTLTYDELAALPIGALAADDAALFVWSTGPWLWLSLQLMAHWGFAYKAQACWPKKNSDGTYHRGHGYWFIDCHELLLVGTRGDMPAPVMGTQELSVIDGPLGAHSRKPDVFRQVIDRYFPGVGKIELFARPPLPAGWDCWGNEVAAGAVP